MQLQKFPIPQVFNSLFIIISCSTLFIIYLFIDSNIILAEEEKGLWNEFKELALLERKEKPIKRKREASFSPRKRQRFSKQFPMIMKPKILKPKSKKPKTNNINETVTVENKQTNDNNNIIKKKKNKNKKKKIENVSTQVESK